MTTMSIDVNVEVGGNSFQIFDDGDLTRKIYQGHQEKRLKLEVLV